MRTYLDCVPCFVRQTIDSARRVTDSPAVHERLLREVLTVAAEMPFDQPPPVMGQLIHRRLRELTGIADPYRTAKQEANTFALQLYPDLKHRIERAADPFALAVTLAMAGNIIDLVVSAKRSVTYEPDQYRGIGMTVGANVRNSADTVGGIKCHDIRRPPLGVKSHLAEEEVQAAIAEALEATPDRAAIDDLRQAVASARSILYLTDNAGEIVFDRLLIERMELNKVTVAVKGSPIINDATRDDAEQVGLTRLVRVIDNGDDLPGTVLASCSESFRREFEAAGLVIAKGQGNYETLNECGRRNVFFLLKVKCPMIARDISPGSEGGPAAQNGTCHLGQMVIRRGVRP